MSSSLTPLITNAQASVSLNEQETTESIANTVLTACTEYQLAVDEAVHTLFGKDLDTKKGEKQLMEFHMLLESILNTLGTVHGYGHHVMNPRTMAIVGEIAKQKYPQEKARVMIKKLGIMVPTESGGYLDMGDTLKGVRTPLKVLSEKKTRKKDHAVPQV